MLHFTILHFLLLCLPQCGHPQGVPLQEQRLKRVEQRLKREKQRLERVEQRLERVEQRLEQRLEREKQRLEREKQRLKRVEQRLKREELLVSLSVPAPVPASECNPDYCLSRCME